MSQHPEHHPQPNRSQDDRLKLVIAGLDGNVRVHAREAADAHLNTYLDEKGGFRGFLRKVWAGNVAREVYQQRLLHQKENEIKQTGNIYIHHETVGDDDWQFIKAVTVDRYIEEYDESIRTEAGETREIISGDESAEHEILRQTVHSLVVDYVDGNIDVDNFEEEKNRRLAVLAAENSTFKDLVGGELLYADNILEIAQVVKARISHERSIDDILNSSDLIAGKATLGVRTEQETTMGARIVEKVSKTGKFLLPLNEATIATTASVIYSVAGWSARTAVGAATRVAVIGAGSATIAGIREYYQTQRDRSQLGREVAQGGETGLSTKKREKLLTTLYEARQANDLTAKVESFRDENGEWKIEDNEQFDELLSSVAENTTRLNMSDVHKKDFIHYSHTSQIESERHELMKIGFKAKSALRQYFESLSDDEQNELLGEVDDFDGLFAERKAVTEAVLLGEVDKYDDLAKKLARKNAFISAGVAAGVGIGLGLAAQEGAAIFNGQQGVFDSINGTESAGDKQTLLDSIFYGNPETPQQTLLEGYESSIVTVADNVTVSHSETLDVVRDQFTNTIDVTTVDGKIFEDLKLTPDGTLSDSARAELMQNGISIKEDVSVSIENIDRTIEMSPQQYIANNTESTAKVSREFWYDNNTTAFDKNELRLDLRTNANGDIEYSVDRMLPGGSYNGDRIADLKNGDYVMAISASSDTQATPFLISVNENGEAIIGKDSPAAQLFTTRDDGSVEFNGRYGELAQISSGNQAEGFSIRPLATDTGPGMGAGEAGSRPLFDTVTDRVPRSVHSYDFDYNVPVVEALEGDVAVPPVLPWVPRGGIGSAVYNSSVDNELSGGYNRSVGEYYRSNPQERQRLLRRMSPRLRSGENPDVVLDEREELSWYRDSQTSEHRARIDSHTELLGALASSVEIVAAIPVAGHQEAENIYRTLKAYTEQSLSKDRYEILLYINNPETDENGNELNSDTTIAEIERFKADYPDMPITYFHETLTKDEANIAFVRKVLNDTALFRALNREQPARRDLILVSNDADTLEMHPSYMANWIEQFDGHSEYDAMLGQLDWDNEVYLKYPEINIATKFFLFRDIILRRKTEGPLITSGANSTFLAKNLAAVGGYNTDNQGAGEDVMIGRSLVAARRGSGRKVIGFAGTTRSRLVTSARRAVHVLETHSDAPYNQWNYGFGAHDELRTAKLKRETFPKYDSPAEVEQLEKDIQYLINQTLEAFELGGAISSESSVATQTIMSDIDREAVERSLAFCGVKYHWQPDGKIRVTDVTSMVKGLKEYEIRTAKRLVPEEQLPITDPVSSVIVSKQDVEETAKQIYLSKEEGKILTTNDGQSYRIKLEGHKRPNGKYVYGILRQRVDADGSAIAPATRMGLDEALDDIGRGAFVLPERQARSVKAPQRPDRVPTVSSPRSEKFRQHLVDGQLVLNDKTALPGYKGNHSGYWRVAGFDKQTGVYTFNELDDEGNILEVVQVANTFVNKLLKKKQMTRQENIIQYV